jgi:hypothetical protein
MEGNRIAGFACPMDGTGCKTLTSEGAEAMWEAAEAAQQERVEKMPEEKDALRAMTEAYTRLKELGWKEAIYCPKDGTVFNAIEPGSSGMHDCSYQGEWPDGKWWIYEQGDIWPSRPCLFKLKEQADD